jgi:hypothetical protein
LENEMNTAIRGNRRSAVRVLAVLLVLATPLSPAMRTPGVTAQDAGAAEALDLPAMALTPMDLADAGQDGYAHILGRSVDHEGGGSLAYRIGRWTDQVTDDDIRTSLEEAGLGRGYQFGLRLPQDPDDPESDLARDLYGWLHEFADENGAADAFALLDDLSAESELVERVEGEEEVGDATALVRVAPGDDSEPRQLVIAFQAGPVITVLQILDSQGEEPAVAEAEALGALQLERIEAGFEGDWPGLGNRVPRLTSDEYHSLYEVRRDQYLRLAGEDLPLSFEEPDAFAARVESAGDATDVYALNQFVQNAETDPPVPDQFNWGSRLYRFVDDEAATDWLAEQPERLENASGGVRISELEPLEDAPTFGDESAAFTYIEDSGDGYPSRVVRVQARVGATVADVRLTSSPEEEPPIAAFEALAADQLVCLTGDGCPNPVTISDALAGQMPGTDERAGHEGVLDLPAMTLTPDDLDDEGLEDYGLGYGETTFPDQVVASTAAARDLDEDEVAEVLEEAGFVRRYDSYLYLPEDEDDPNGPASRLVASYVLEFADEEGAETAFDFLEDESESETAQDLDDAEEFGDQSEITADRGEDPASGDEYAQLDLTVRLGNLHAGVAIVDWSGEEPDLADVEALGERLLERVESVLEEGAPGLGAQVLRLTGPALVLSADYYVVLDGAALPLSGQAPRDARARDRAAAEIDQTDGYRFWQQLAPGGDDQADDVWYLAELLRFEDEDAASNWIGDTEDRIAANEDLTDLEVEESSAGDEALFYAVETVDGDTNYRSVVIRVGATVATIDLSGPEAPPGAAIAALAAAQVACLEDEGCPEPLALPARVEDYVEGLDQADRDDDADRDEDDRDDSPEDEDEDDASREDGSADAEGETYVSPTWGYTVTWDPDSWVATGEEREDGVALHVMGSVIVLAVVEGVEGYDGDPDACLTGMVEAAAGDTPLVASEEYRAPATADDAVGGVYELGTFAVAYLECRPLVDGEAVLQTRFVAPVDEYEAVLPALEELLAGIEAA